MKALQIFNAVALALSLTFAVTLGVVALIYAIYLDASPRMRAEWPTVALVTGVFWALSAITGLTFWAQRRVLAWRWLAQAASVTSSSAAAGMANLRIYPPRSMARFLAAAMRTRHDPQRRGQYSTCARAG